MSLGQLLRLPSTASAVAFAGVCGLCLAAPFERLQPVISLPWQLVTNVEIVVTLAVGAWLLALLIARSTIEMKTAVTVPAIALLAALMLSALLAPAHAANAFKVVARLGVAGAVFLLTVYGIRDADRMRTVLALASLAGAVVGACALGEYLGIVRVLTFLEQFRDGVHVVGGQVRASGTLQYPTIASMYLEIVFALALGLFVGAIAERQWIASGFILGGIAFIAEGILVTFTRAGLVTMGASLIVVGGWRFRRQGFDAGVWATCAAAVVVGGLLVTSWSSEALRLRFTSENRQGWYSATFDAPPDLAFDAGDTQFVGVLVTNNGRITWQGPADNAFNASYHWIDEHTSRVIDYDGIRTPFPNAVVPGETVALEMEIRAPVRAGRYRLVWDVVQEHRLWFGAEVGAAVTMTNASVTGVTSARPAVRARGTPASLPVPVRSVGRGALWLAAMRVLATHPLLGIGLDNFRLSYGPYAGLERPDPRVTSNNTYLEVLAGGGLLAGAALCWLLWRVAATIPARWQALRGMAADPLYSGAVAAACAILLHSLVDSFLTFTPTYLTMAITLGLLTAPITSRREAQHAHRV
jgi:hypothetical protein